MHQAAVADRNGQAEFLHVENAPAYSGLRRRIYDRPDPQIAIIRVMVVALDDVIPADQPLAFMKIDIEGGEYHALLGAANTIRRCRPVIVLEAGSKSTGQYGVTPAELFALVSQSFGYDLILDNGPMVRPDASLHERAVLPELGPWSGLLFPRRRTASDQRVKNNICRV